MIISFRPTPEQAKVLEKIKSKSDYLRRAVDFYLNERDSLLLEIKSLKETLSETNRKLERLNHSEDSSNETNQKLDQILSMLESGVITTKIKKQAEEASHQENKPEEETNKEMMDFFVGGLKDFDI